MIANGGSTNNRDSVANTYAGIKKFWKDSGASSVMIARACEWNPSVFRSNGEKDDIFDVSNMLKVTKTMSGVLNNSQQNNFMSMIVAIISGCT